MSDSLVVYRGPSMLNGAPIRAVLTRTGTWKRGARSITIPAHGYTVGRAVAQTAAAA